MQAFLSKYVDENAMFRRRSQSEDDNPPSPISTMMEMDHSVGTPGSGGGGPGSSSPFLTRSQQPSSPAPGRSNPHTPASPHIQQAVSATANLFNVGLDESLPKSSKLKNWKQTNLKSDYNCKSYKLSTEKEKTKSDLYVKSQRR